MIQRAIDPVSSCELNHIWHPCSQMKDYKNFPPLEVTHANGSYFQLANGRKVIDAISSWWCKSLGHGHPRLKQALLRQLDSFEHVILANTTNETIIGLSQRLAQLTSTLNKVFYASDGSSAVEIALKMSLHTRSINGEKNRNQFISLKHGYHGETTGALSVSDLGLYRDAYQPILFKSHFIADIPYVHTTNDPLWHDCSEHWQNIQNSLEPLANTTTAIIVEPILQAAGGMQIYSQDLLKRLRKWTSERGIHLIADEIMTGIARTGKLLACEHAGIEPDFLCLGKGLTSGWLPLSAVVTRNDIYQLFYDDYSTGKSFLHSNTFCGNALAASIACEMLDIAQEINLSHRAERMGHLMHDYMLAIASETKMLTNVRSIGAMVAADILCEPHRRIGFEVFQHAVKLGAFLRPLGNTLYWVPPMNTTHSTLLELKNITQRALELCK